MNPPLWLISVVMFLAYYRREAVHVKQVKHSQALVSDFTLAVGNLSQGELDVQFVKHVLAKNYKHDRGEHIELDIAKVSVCTYKGNIA